MSAKTFNRLCAPAKFYFVIAAIGIILTAMQNLGNNGMYTLGNMSCAVPSTLLVFIVKVLYVIFWTWILNLICRDGFEFISWILVLFPFIMIFLVMLMAVRWQ